jgi:hypothetical protein
MEGKANTKASLKPPYAAHSHANLFFSMQACYFLCKPILLHASPFHMQQPIPVMTSNNVSELSLYSRSVLSKTLLLTVIVQVQNVPKDQVKSEFDELHKECHLQKEYCLSEFENDLVGNPTKF